MLPKKLVSQTLFKGFVLLHVLRPPSHAGVTMQQLDNPAILYLPSTIFCTCMTCLSAAMCCLSAVIYKMAVTGSVSLTGNRERLLLKTK